LKKIFQKQFICIKWLLNEMIQLVQVYQKVDETERNIPEAIHLYQIVLRLNDSFAMI
jgi:hypothetical protein